MNLFKLSFILFFLRLNVGLDLGILYGVKLIFNVFKS